MATSFTGRKRVRKDFGQISTPVDMPNLIEVQKSSYDFFLQKDVPAAERQQAGLQEVFKSVFPIKDFTGSAGFRFGTHDPLMNNYIHNSVWGKYAIGAGITSDGKLFLKN